MWVSFDTTIYAYLYVYGMSLLSDSFDTKVYMGIYIYMEVFSLQPRAQMFISADIIVELG